MVKRNSKETNIIATELTCEPLKATSGNDLISAVDKRPLYEEISLEDYIKEHPEYNNIFSRFFSNILSNAQIESLVKKRVITYRDYQTLVDRAKQTKFGLLILTIGKQKIIFTANPSVQNQLISLEKGAENKVTARVLKTGNNQRLLENNPVAANALEHEHNYIREQQEFFSKIAQASNFADYVQKVFPQKSPSRTSLTSDQCIEIIGKKFTQLYFQALFSRSDYKNPESSFIDDTIAANVETHYQKIANLYAEIEKCTGKHGLTFGNFISGSSANDASHETGDSKLIPLLYDVICGIYGKVPNIGMTDEEAIAAEIIRLMEQHGARVLPVFAKLPNPTNQCFNLLSWLDNSLNIINTLSNYVVKISEDKSLGFKARLYL